MPTALAFAAVLFSAIPVPPGTQLTYSGSLAPVKADEKPATKKFDLNFVVLGEAANMGWVLSESGRGGWTWLDRFGRLLDLARSVRASLGCRAGAALSARRRPFGRADCRAA